MSEKELEKEIKRKTKKIPAQKSTKKKVKRDSRSDAGRRGQWSSNTKPPTQVGRPGSYDPKWGPIFIAEMEKGKSMAEFFNENREVNARKFHLWAKQNIEFRKDYETGVQASQAYWERALRALALGQFPKANFAAMRWYMLNRFHNDWKSDPSMVQQGTETIENVEYRVTIAESGDFHHEKVDLDEEQVIEVEAEDC